MGFETPSRYIGLAGLELAMQPRLASNLSFSCLRLPSAGIIDGNHQAQILISLFLCPLVFLKVFLKVHFSSLLMY
jgi:hypothetical protein